MTEPFPDPVLTQPVVTQPVLHPAVREATRADVSRIRELIGELAAYERSADLAKATEEQLGMALFGERPAVFALVAEAHGEVVGFALWFLNFSTWRGVHGIYLEDLYVRPAARGGGLGRALLTTLADICQQRGYERLDWWVLDWNPAREFYGAMGAAALDEWIPYRLAGSALARLAAGESRAHGAAPTT